MTKREAVLREWKICQAKVSQLKAKSIDNYPRVRKITLLDLNSHFLQTNDEQEAGGVLCDLFINNGSVTKTSAKTYGQTGVELAVQVLEVAILKDLTNEDNCTLTNYVKDELKPCPRPRIQMID